MSIRKGYYSLVQYCPDHGRAEKVNVGIILVVPEEKFLEAKFTPLGDPRARRTFGLNDDQVLSLHDAKKALSSRLAVEKSELCELVGFHKFASTRGNDLVLTAPRSVMLDSKDEIEFMYTALVADCNPDRIPANARIMHVVYSDQSPADDGGCIVRYELDGGDQVVASIPPGRLSMALRRTACPDVALREVVEFERELGL